MYASLFLGLKRSSLHGRIRKELRFPIKSIVIQGDVTEHLIEKLDEVRDGKVPVQEVHADGVCYLKGSAIDHISAVAVYALCPMGIPQHDRIKQLKRKFHFVDMEPSASGHYHLRGLVYRQNNTLYIA